MRYAISDLRFIHETLTALLRQAVWQYGQQSSPVSHLGAEHRDEKKAVNTKIRRERHAIAAISFTINGLS